MSLRLRCFGAFVGLLLLFLRVVEGDKPNILVIIVDDVGYGDLGLTTEGEMLTPNLDRMAKEGVQLKNHYVTPLCNPTRTALLTARYAHRTGIDNPSFPDSVYGLPTEEYLMSQYLKENGYSTHLVGKWHLGFSMKEYLPTNRGFNTHYGYYSDQIDYYDYSAQRIVRGQMISKLSGIDFAKNGEHLNLTGEYSTFVFGNRTINLLKEHAENKNPFYIQLALNAIHAPQAAPEYYVEACAHIKSKQRRLACACLLAADESIGEVERALKEYGLYKNTLILFFSDNGGDLFYESKNLPFKGGKGDSWEGGIKSFSFLSGGYINRVTVTPQENNALIFVGDWFPSFASIIGKPIPVASERPLDGVNIWESILDPKKPSARTELLIALDNTGLPGGRKAIRVGDLKFMINPTSPGNLKLKDLLNGKFLFNLSSDPLETNNLIAQFPEIAKNMSKKLDNYLSVRYYRTLIFDTAGSNPANFEGFWDSWLDKNNTVDSCEANWACETVCSYNTLPFIFYLELTRACPFGDNIGALGKAREWRRDFNQKPCFRTPPINCGHDVRFWRAYILPVVLTFGALYFFSYFTTFFNFNPALGIFTQHQQRPHQS